MYQNGAAALYTSRKGAVSMGEKGNLLDTGEEVFANLAEQGPQFWAAYEQYKEARDRNVRPQVVAENREAAQDQTVQWPRPPAAQ
jgi:hypothetical protein